MQKWLTGGAVVAAALLSFGGVGSAQAPKTVQQCFRSSDWHGWKATPDARSLYIGLGINRVARLDLAQACPELNDIDPKLITLTSGGWTCDPLQIRLYVRSRAGLPNQCLVSGITNLTKDEVSALPKALRP